MLTSKLSLVALAITFLLGDSEIAYRYPMINTWRTAPGGVIKHNTSGETLKEATRGVVIEEPEGEEAAEDDDEEAEPQFNAAPSTMRSPGIRIIMLLRENIKMLLFFRL